MLLPKQLQNSQFACPLSVLLCIYKKSPEERGFSFVLLGSLLHQISNSRTAVVNVRIYYKCTVALCCALGEWVGNHTITSLEANLWLEGVRIDCTNHLERNVW